MHTQQTFVCDFYCSFSRKSNSFGNQVHSDSNIEEFGLIRRQCKYSAYEAVARRVVCCRALVVEETHWCNLVWTLRRQKYSRARAVFVRPFGAEVVMSTLAVLSHLERRKGYKALYTVASTPHEKPVQPGRQVHVSRLRQQRRRKQIACNACNNCFVNHQIA